MYKPQIDKLKERMLIERLTNLEKKVEKHLMLDDVAELGKRVERLENKLLLNKIALLEERIEELEKKNDK